jgi:general secretion pathway protein C
VRPPAAAFAIAVALACGCGGATGRPDYPAPDDEPMPARATSGLPAAPAAPGTSRTAVRRAELDETLAAGPGALLARVRVEAVGRRRFAGWRILSLPEDPRLALQPGDVVRRVNGLGLERPEDLSRVFEALRAAPEIVVEYERGGERRAWRLPIVP